MSLPPPTKLGRLCNPSHLCVSQQDCCKSNQLIWLKLGVMIGPTNRKNRLIFGGKSAPNADHLSTSLSIPEWDILWDLFISISHSHQLLFAKLGEMTDTDKRMNPHFGNNPVDTRIPSGLIHKSRFESQFTFSWGQMHWRRYVFSESYLDHYVSRSLCIKPSPATQVQKFTSPFTTLLLLNYTGTAS